MQTRLRSRLGLSGSDELPDPTPARAAPAQKRPGGVTLTNLAGSQTSHELLPSPAAASSSVLTPHSPAATVLRLRRSASTVVDHQQGHEHASSNVGVRTSDGNRLSTTKRFDHTDSKTVKPHVQWHRVFLEAVESRTQHQQHEQEKERVHSSLHGALLQTMHRIRHEHRLEMLAADQETEFREDILQEARERKRRRAEEKNSSQQRKKVVIVDSEESDGVGGEEEELVRDGRSLVTSLVLTSSPRASSRGGRGGRRPAENLSSDEDDENGGALWILKVIDRIDRQVEKFSKRNAALAESYLGTATTLVDMDGSGGGAPSRQRVTKIWLKGQRRSPPPTAASAAAVIWSPVAVERGTTHTAIFPLLLPFQRDGVHWMMDTMLVRRLNCVLADEMGLGKTISTIALASALSQVKAMHVQDPTHRVAMMKARESNIVIPTKLNPVRSRSCGHGQVKKNKGGRRREAHAVSDSSESDISSDGEEKDFSSRKRKVDASASLPVGVSSASAWFSARSALAACPWTVAPTLVVAPLSTLPNWAAEFQKFEPRRFRVFTINGEREDRERQLDAFFTLLMRIHGVRMQSRPARGRGARNNGKTASGKNRAANSQHVLEKCQRILWGDTDALPCEEDEDFFQSAEEGGLRIPVLLMPHDYFARKLDHHGRRLVQSVHWELVVIDEAQRIKSNQSKLFYVLHSVRANHRLALSGTPLQNNILEMFSLMEFILPDMFRSQDEGTSTLTSMLHDALTTASSGTSKKKSSMPTAECSSAHLSSSYEDAELQMLLCRRVHKLLSPFLLRREKAAVIAQLPKKDDIVVVCPVTRLQERFIATLDRKREQRLLTGSHTLGVRKVLMHPYLSLNAFFVEERMVYTSGKFMVLDALLRFLDKFAHKTLVFCSWVKVLDIVDSMCTMRGIKFVRLQGGTHVLDRQENIKTFSRAAAVVTRPLHKEEEADDVVEISAESSDVASSTIPSCEPGAGAPSASWSPSEGGAEVSSPVNCFLISKIAGGVGLNLQVADTVILLDTDYNPQRDAQALSRVYRVGQTKHVKVFRLVTNHPVEEHMMQVALDKHQLEEVVVKAGRYDLKSTGSDRDQHIRSVFRSMSDHHAGEVEHCNAASPTNATEDAAAASAEHSKWSIVHHIATAAHAFQGPLTEQLLASVPRSDEERVALREMLSEHWEHLDEAEIRDIGVDVSEEEAAWLRGTAK